MASPKMNLKLLVDKKGQRVLFAEATKEFVDFLFHVLSLPLGTLIELLGSKQMVGCLGKLKESIDSFNGSYLQPGIKKDDIFNPKTAYNGNTLLLLSNDASFQQTNASKKVYRCSRAPKVICTYFGGYVATSCDCEPYVTTYFGAACPSCNLAMKDEMTFVMPKEKKEAEVEKNVISGGGYVKEVVTYMVMDDLVVKPMSTISSITLINSFGVIDLSQLQEKAVSFGKDEALKLLMASLKTEKVLTSLFLDNHHA